MNRVKGGLRVLATVTIPERDWDETRAELAARRYEALAHCARIEPSLNRLYGASLCVSPAFEQLAAAALHEVARYRRQNGGES